MGCSEDSEHIRGGQPMNNMNLSCLQSSLLRNHLDPPAGLRVSGESGRTKKRCRAVLERGLVGPRDRIREPSWDLCHQSSLTRGLLQPFLLGPRQLVLAQILYCALSRQFCSLKAIIGFLA